MKYQINYLLDFLQFMKFFKEILAHFYDEKIEDKEIQFF